jgi:hypothetical protein
MPSPAQATGPTGAAPAGTNAPGAPSAAAPAPHGTAAGADTGDEVTANGATSPPENAQAGGEAGRGPAILRRELPDWALAAITAVVTLPVVWMGYGTDLDVAALKQTGALIRDLDYQPSRTPGVPVFEAIVAVLDPLGHVAINLAAALTTAVAVVGIARLVRQFGRPNGDLIALAFLASPIALVAASSTADFMYAIAFFVWAAWFHLRDRSIVAGLLFALAIGCRSSSFIIIGLFLLADFWTPASRRRCLMTAAVVVPAAGLLFVPSWMAYDRTLGFLEHSEGWRGFNNNVGRFGYKNYYVAGPLLILAALSCVPALVRSLRDWGHNHLARVGFLCLAGTELLFLQVPWKPAHLLPAVLMFVLWVAATDRNRRPFLFLLIAVIAINGIIAIRPLTPDRPDESQTADFHPTVQVGPFLNDLRCRERYMDVEPEILNGAWFCSLEPMRGPTIVSQGEVPADVVPTNPAPPG